MDQEEYYKKYTADLEDLMRKASSQAKAVCVAWHGEKFGVPGDGGVSFVAMELEKAEIAVRVLCCE